MVGCITTRASSAVVLELQCTKHGLCGQLSQYATVCKTSRIEVLRIGFKVIVLYKRSASFYSSIETLLVYSKNLNVHSSRYNDCLILFSFICI